VNSKIHGRVVIGRESNVENSTIKGPCIIGRGCRISDSYIGPYTSINDGCEIVGTEMEDSIVMAGGSILNAGRIIESLIGKNVRIRENGQRPTGSKFVVGDNSDITM
jgi:glucose-1-phosphate thymidylyltransferase